MATRMQQRRGTAQQWTTANPRLAAGEIGFETDTGKFKVGDDVNFWDDLAYFVNSDDLSGELGGYATEGFVTDTINTAVSDLVGGAPEVLNTLSEISAAIGDDTEFFSFVNSINTKADQLEERADGQEETLGTQTTAITNINTTISSVQSDLEDKLDSSVAAGIYAPINDPTFGGTVSLPSATSIGDVSSTEIGYVNGVTSAIQTQLNAKAPSADPTFTGTVTGVTKAHVGLANVDDTSDADKPVSTATQTALDAKASLSGATFTGDVTLETNLVIEGNLTISGTTTTVNATDLSISDPLIYLAAEQYTEDVLDVGFLAATGEVGGTEESHLHSGFFRDVSDSAKWKLVSNVPHPVNNVVDVTNAVKDTLVVGNLEATGVVFSDGTQTKQGVPSITTISAKTDSYELSNLNERDTIVEIEMASAATLTIPTNSSIAYPVGTTIDIIQTGSGQITIAGAAGVTVNATPGLKLRTQWSSATLLKRAENTWLVYGDLTA
jgi:hypothetical protein